MGGFLTPGTATREVTNNVSERCDLVVQMKGILLESYGILTILRKSNGFPFPTDIFAPAKVAAPAAEKLAPAMSWRWVQDKESPLQTFLSFLRTYRFKKSTCGVG